jgi:hypothetical protein
MLVSLTAAASLAVTLGGPPPPPWPTTPATPTSVTVAGSFQSELGCPDDWQPGCALTNLADADGDGTWTGAFVVPAGAWEFKAALDGSWDQSFPAGNLALSLASDTR